MKEIVKYAVVTPKGDCVAIYDGLDEVRASGYYLDIVTIVKLVGTLPDPKKLRKCRHEIWIKPCKMDDGQNNLWDLLGITQYDTAKSDYCKIRAIVTMEEVEE
jgi:predicted NACHT family NTPase